MCFLILFHSMNLMCFADHLNSLLLTFCSLCFILSLLLCFVQNLLFLKMKATQTHFSFYVFDFNLSNVPNKISYTHTRLLNFQEFSNTPPHRLLSFGKFSNALPPVYSTTPTLLLGTQE